MAIFSNNELFSHERLIAYCKTLREKCSDSFLHIFSNGSLLTVDDFTTIMSYLDRMNIDKYNDDKAMKLNISDIYKYW